MDKEIFTFIGSIFVNIDLYLDYSKKFETVHEMLVLAVKAQGKHVHSHSLVTLKEWT